MLMSSELVSPVKMLLAEDVSRIWSRLLHGLRWWLFI